VPHDGDERTGRVRPAGAEHDAPLLALDLPAWTPASGFPSAPGAGRVTFSPSVLTRIFTSCRNIAASMFSASAARGARKLSLRVLGSNAPALRLYERHGYLTQGRYSEEFLTNGEFVNDLTMTKALGSGHARGSAV
jgi:hypothetical protein